MLNGIDIASYQASLKPSRMSTTDFIVVKATGGTQYKNPEFKRHMDESIKAGKLIGAYCFAQESYCKGTAKAEADFFVKAFEPYVGKAIPYLDWEADALALDPSWALAWCDRVYAKTGVKPGIYMSKSVANAHDWSKLAAKGYPLWVAQYPDYNTTGYKSKPWTDSSPFGAWGKPEMFQYTSSGSIPGYDGRLDLDLFYGDKAAWMNRCAVAGTLATFVASTAAIVSNSAAAANQVVVNCAEVAAKIHQRMCDDPGFGYSWEERYGTDTDKVTWVIEGRSYTLNRGDYDCSSSVITAWKMALQGTPYEGVLDGAQSTHSMRSVFLASGLFEAWDTSSTYAVRGDVYLNDQNHTALCQDGGTGDGPYGKDMLSEFCINEKGGTHGGKRGDQTGYEAYVHEFYEYWAGWDVTLHYNGKANGLAKATSPSQTGEVSKATGRTKLNVDGDWGPLTTKELQRQLKVTVDGNFGPQSTKALQKKLKVKADGVFGPVTKKALQKKLKVTVDGYVGPQTIKALQKALNKGQIAKW